MTHRREDTPDRYPGPSFIDEVFVLLQHSAQDGEATIPTFARHVLEELRGLGLLHTIDDEPPANVRRVRLTSKGKVQDVWLRYDTVRTPRGYMDVEVVEAPPSDAAILAAVVARGTEPMPFERLLSAMAARRAWEVTMGTSSSHSTTAGGKDLQALQDWMEAYLQDLQVL